VEATAPPEGITDGNWFEYVITYGKTRMVGKKPGTQKGVTAHANAVVEDLNTRSQKGGSYFAPSQRQNKKT
jgi:hypothetical protein